MRNLVILLLLLGVAVDQGASKGKLWRRLKEKVWPIIRKVVDAIGKRHVDSIDLNKDMKLSEDELVAAFGEDDARALLAIVDTNGDSILEGEEIEAMANLFSNV